MVEQQQCDWDLAAPPYGTIPCVVCRAPRLSPPSSKRPTLFLFVLKTIYPCQASRALHRIGQKYITTEREKTEVSFRSGDVSQAAHTTIPFCIKDAVDSRIDTDRNTYPVPIFSLLYRPCTTKREHCTYALYFCKVGGQVFSIPALTNEYFGLNNMLPSPPIMLIPGIY